MDHPLTPWCPTCGIPQETPAECPACQIWWEENAFTGWLFNAVSRSKSLDKGD